LLSPILASGLTNCQQNRSGACHLCRVGDKIFPENPATGPRHRVAVRNLRQRRNALTADYADFADSKERNQEQHSVLLRAESVESALSVVRFGRRLHKLNGRAIGIANVNDAFAGVRTRPKSLRFTGSLPTRSVDRA